MSWEYRRIGDLAVQSLARSWRLARSERSAIVAVSAESTASGTLGSLLCAFYLCCRTVIASSAILDGRHCVWRMWRMVEIHAELDMERPWCRCT